MPTFVRQGTNINYEVLGQAGRWIVLTPGGRGSLEDVRELGKALADSGYRVVLHDRRNCGKSDIFIGGEKSEQELWADDVHALLQSLDALPVIAGGGSAGCRLSLLLAIKFPDAISALLLWWVTGGQYAANHLGHAYYGQFIELAREGGMEAVCSSEFFAERIASNPGNQERLLSMTPSQFVDVMARWRDFFTAGADLPVIGATEEMLASITVPACIIPGSDEVHPGEVAVNLCKILQRAELTYPFQRDELDHVKGLGVEELMALFRQRLAGHFVSFLARTYPQASAAGTR